MTIFDQMISGYNPLSKRDKLNATYEVMQQIALAGLYRGGFFSKAAFYGGTCLRIFHGMDRFSEDMDFSLLEPDTNFNIEDYFPDIINEFHASGKEVSLAKKEKRTFGKVESAFLKDNTETYDLYFKTEKSVKIKIEVDTDPPLDFETEQKLILLPYSFMTRCYTLPNLFAGKVHALIFRNWKNRVKGRDWYDFEWYVRNGVPLNTSHLQSRIKQFNDLNLSREEVINLLIDRLSSTDIELVKRDVVPFIKNPDTITIWSNDYFRQLAGMLKWQ